MARAWIKDRWLSKDAPPSVKRLLNSAAGHPERVADRIPDIYKLANYGRGKRWVVCWYENQDGVRRERNKSFERKADAEKARTAIEDDQYAGRYINEEDKRRLFSAASDEWIASLHSARDSSVKQYEDLLRTYVLPQWGETALMDISETMVNEWIQALRDCSAPHEFKVKRKPKPPTPKYLNQLVNVTFGGVLRYSLRRGWLRANPMENVRVSRRDDDPEREARRKVFLTYEQVEALADAAAQFRDGGRDAAMIRLMAYVGTRPGETYALRKGDVDLERRRLTVSRSLTKDREGNWKIGATKTGRTRTVPIPDFLADVLKPLVTGEPDDYLFPARGGGFLRPENWRGRAFDRATKLAKLDKIKGLRPHSLRHTYASLAIAAGCDVRTLADILGHADVTMTLNEYAGLWPDRLDEVADKLAANRTAAKAAAKTAAANQG